MSRRETPSAHATARRAHAMARGCVAAVVALWSARCGAAEPPLPPPGSIAAGRPAARWPGFDAARAWPQVGSPFPSRGHGVPQEYVATVRVSPDAIAAYRALVSGAALPEGAGIAVFHTDPRGRPGSVFVMEKRAGAWTFVATDPAGVPLEGDPSLCAECHRDGLADHLFGTPRATAGMR